MLTIAQKEKIIKKLRLHEHDTGSAEVQIGLLTKELEVLSDHLKKHPKDVHSRRGLLGMVSQRKKLQDYLKKEDEKRYNKLVKKLGLKK